LNRDDDDRVRIDLVDRPDAPRTHHVAAPGGRAADTPSSAEALASRIAPSSADVWCAAIESGRAAQRWTIWRLDLAALERLGHAGNRHVLRWLGDHHDQVWCAPVRDIAAYRGAAPHGGV